MNGAGSGMRVVAALAAGLVLLPATGTPQAQDERAVRAAYVFNLTKLVEWPPETRQLVIGLVGNRETGEFLHKMLDGTTSESRGIRVMLFPTDEEREKCNLVYIAESQSGKVHAIIDKLGNKPIVSVGETEWFARDGGIIGLVKSGTQIQMQVNVEAAQKAGVRISPRLLNLAQTVTSATPASEDQAERKVVRIEQPVYPVIAAKMALHGTVRVKVWISADGRVRKLECVGGHPVLADSALKAVKQWKFETSSRESVQVVVVEF